MEQNDRKCSLCAAVLCLRLPLVPTGSIDVRNELSFCIRLGGDLDYDRFCKFGGTAPKYPSRSAPVRLLKEPGDIWHEGSPV